MAMECKNCEGRGKLTDMLGYRETCRECNGLGVLPRFIYEEVERDCMKHYLNTDPHPRYRMVSASLDSEARLFHIIFEENE